MNSESSPHVHAAPAYSDYLGPAVPDAWRPHLDAALAAGREATELVRESRQYLDGLVASAAVVA